MNKLKRMNGRERTFLLITIPILALFFCFNTLPLIKGVIYSFTNFRGYGEFDWVGIRNYTDLFTDARVGKSYLFTFKLAIVATIVVNVLSLVLALGLNSKIKFKSALRGMYFVPNILGALVVGYIFNYFFTYILPAVVKMMGGKGDSILASSKWAWVAIVIVCAWQSVAMNTIIYISGLQTVPEDVYEAGSLDGATGWKKFKNLTFPLILPFFTINMVLCMKNFLMVFDQIMALTKGGPAQSTESISFLIYNNGMAGGTTKYAIRKAAERHIPEATAMKKKLGFPVPITLWLREDKYYNRVKEAFTSPAAKTFFNTDELVKLLDQHKSGKLDNSKKIWVVYMFLMWYDVYFVRENVAF